MANSEDYLDSLLRAASTQNDNPQSAINKVREINIKEAEEKAIADLRAAREAEEALKAATDAMQTLPEEVSKTEDIDETSTEVPEEESVPLSDSRIDKIFSDELYIDQPVVKNETPINLDEIITESVSDAVNTDEPDIADSLIPEVTEELNLEPMNTDVLAESEDEVVSEDELKQEVTEEASEPKDLDSFLKSDFSGEIDMSDLDSLFNDANAFANSEASEEEATPAGNEESLDLKAEDDDSPLDIDSLISQFEEKENLTSDKENSDDSSEDVLSLSEEEISNMISAASGSEEKTIEEPIEIDLSDLDSLESLGIKDKNDISDINLSSDGDLGDLSDLLNAAESNEVIDASNDNLLDADVLDLLNDAVIKSEAHDEEIAREKEEKAKASKEAKEAKKKKRKEKKKKSEETESDVVVEKKKSAFSKIIDFLTAEEEEDEADLLKPQDITPTEGSEAATNGEGFEGVQGENKAILDEIDKEEDDGKKKKKKKKKGKKGKDEEKSEGEEGEDGEGSEDDKKKKKKKPKKEKPEKKPLELDIDTGKPLSKRNVRLIFVLAATLLVAILLVIKIVPGVLSNSQARRAYYDGDYETVYTTFYGNKLSDSDQILFNRSAIVLKMSHKYDAYMAYMNMDKKTEALDQLLQGVSKYETWLYEAESAGAENAYKQAYALVTGALQSTFNLSEEDAIELINISDDLEYTLRLYSVATGTEYIDLNNLPGEFVPPTEDRNESIEQTDEPAEGELSDVLSEEGN